MEDKTGLSGCVKSISVKKKRDPERGGSNMVYKIVLSRELVFNRMCTSPDGRVRFLPSDEDYKFMVLKDMARCIGESLVREFGEHMFSLGERAREGEHLTLSMDE